MQLEKSVEKLKLIPMFAMIPAEIGGCTGGQRTYRTWSRTRSNTRSRLRLRTLSESVVRVIRTRRNRRSGRYSVHTSGGGRLPDLVSFSSKLAWIRDIFFHQVVPDVWREMIEKEAFEEKAFTLVNPVGQRQQVQHLPHQLGGLLVSGQGEGHELLIPLERVESV